jgi:hypothetical protein
MRRYALALGIALVFVLASQGLAQRIRVNGVGQGGSSITLCDGCVAFGDGANTIGGDATFVWSKTTDLLKLGASFYAAGLLSSAAKNNALSIGADDDGGYGATLVLQSDGPNASFPLIKTFTSAGSMAVPAANVDTNALFQLSNGGFDGSAFVETMVLAAYADGAVSAGIVPGELRVSTMTPAGAYNTWRFRSNGSLDLPNAGALRTDTTTAHTALLQAYDVNDTTYRTFATLTNGDVPDFTLAAPAGGSLSVGGMVLTTAVVPAMSGTRFLCINTAGAVTSSTTACSGT